MVTPIISAKHCGIRVTNNSGVPEQYEVEFVRPDGTTYSKFPVSMTKSALDVHRGVSSPNDVADPDAQERIRQATKKYEEVRNSRGYLITQGVLGLLAMACEALSQV